MSVPGFPDSGASLKCAGGERSRGLSVTDPYAELAALAEAALELTREDDEAGVTALLDRSTALAAEPPGPPPASARAELELVEASLRPFRPRSVAAGRGPRRGAGRRA
jgi:hypothetical protein